MTTLTNAVRADSRFLPSDPLITLALLRSTVLPINNISCTIAAKTLYNFVYWPLWKLPDVNINHEFCCLEEIAVISLPCPSMSGCKNETRAPNSSLALLSTTGLPSGSGEDARISIGGHCVKILIISDCLKFTHVFLFQRYINIEFLRYWQNFTHRTVSTFEAFSPFDVDVGM